MSEAFCKLLDEKMKECYKCPIEMCDSVCMLHLNYKKWKNGCEKYEKKHALKHKKKSFRFYK